MKQDYDLTEVIDDIEWEYDRMPDMAVCFIGGNDMDGEGVEPANRAWWYAEQYDRLSAIGVIQ